MTVHTLHTEIARMIGGNTGKSHHRAADRCIDQLGKCQQLVRRIGRDQATAEIQIRTLTSIDTSSSSLNTVIFRTLFTIGSTVRCISTKRSGMKAINLFTVPKKAVALSTVFWLQF